jgi:hypothetical protein
VFEVANAWRAEHGLPPIEATTESMLKEAAAASDLPDSGVNELSTLQEVSESDDEDLETVETPDHRADSAVGQAVPKEARPSKHVSLSAVNELFMEEDEADDGDEGCVCAVVLMCGQPLVPVPLTTLCIPLQHTAGHESSVGGQVHPRGHVREPDCAGHDVPAGSQAFVRKAWFVPVQRDRLVYGMSE